MELKFRTLRVDEIDCRVAQCKKTDYKQGVNLLLYKDARVDMDMLDEAVGAMNWQRSHLRENANCVVSIWDDEKKQWISKEDTGTESNTEAAKGLCSDSFKRACFNWGIGRELYTAPAIFVEWELEEEKGRLKPKYSPTFYVKDIDYDDKRNISKLVIHAKSGKSDKEVFNWQNGRSVEQKKRQAMPKQPSKSDYDTTPANKLVPPDPDTLTIDEVVINSILASAKKMAVEEREITKWINEKFGKEKLSQLTTKEANLLCEAILNKKSKISHTSSEADNTANPSSKEEKPIKTQTMSFDEAMGVCFASGKIANVPFGDLKDNQLEWIAEKSKGKYQQAAQLILQSREERRASLTELDDLPF